MDGLIGLSPRDAAASKNFRTTRPCDGVVIMARVARRRMSGPIVWGPYCFLQNPSLNYS